MKQVAQNYRSGELAVLDAPRPSCMAGGVLVRTAYSLISTGTELMKVSESKLSLVGKARSRPDQVAKVLEVAAQQGPATAYKKAMNRLDSYTPLGYSLSGVVVQVGAGAEEFRIGQRVACAGNEYALHAEYNWVPRNLVVAVPDGVPTQAAAFSTVGAIAMQGVRQAQPQLGETACVIGLGLVGQLVVQLLVASGLRVVGLDVRPERCRAAEKGGAVLCAAPDEAGIAAVERKLAEMSGGLGADRIFLVAGGSSNGPVEVAARLARDRATVIDIGKCRLDLPWNAYYEKEIDLRFSRSYGPGRYDPRYELDGMDYPAGYVRWTERRNMECFLALAAQGEINPESLISAVIPLDDAASTYRELEEGKLAGIGFLFEYPGSANSQDALPVVEPPAAPVVRPDRRVTVPATGRVRVGFIGAGNYASSMLLPHLAHRDDVDLVRVATRRSLSALNAERKFGFTSSTTDVDAVLADQGIDAVFVVTRHSSHADLVVRALEAGKSVFVEKPLVLDHTQLDAVAGAVARTGNDRLMVGFNRRFSPALAFMRDRLDGVAPASLARYLVNAGPLGRESWYGDEEQEGSRFVGEGGHFIDTLCWLFRQDPESVTATRIGSGGSLDVTLRFGDGSSATISYLTDGHPRFPKETLDLSGGGRSARLDNFTKVAVWAGRRRKVKRALGAPDKGQRSCLEAFLDAVRTATPMPIPLPCLLATSRATLAVPASLASGGTELV